ncbi:MAG: DUF1508 domain-containing protein [Candidatus Bathyarchaeia archaeon]
MNAKYEVYKDVAGKYRFRLRAPNNKIVAVSQAYEQKAGCINGVHSIQKNCRVSVEDKTVKAESITYPKYDVFTDAASKFRFNLSASNGEIIAASEAYETKQNAMNGIEAMQRSCDAEIVDLTTNQVVEETVAEAPTEMAEDAGDTNLELYCPPTRVNLNSIVQLKGKLTNSKTGKGISGADIGIWEKDRSFMSDNLLGSGKTNADGTYEIDWKAKQLDWWDDATELYAKFGGTTKYTPAKTDPRKIKVLVYLRNKE